MSNINLYKIIMKDKETKNNVAMSSYMFNEDEVVEFISLNVISLNLIYSGRFDGGIPKGRMSMISAPSMMGKSFIAYGVVRNAQKDGMQVCIIDTERAFNFKFAESIGVDISPEKLVVLQENSIEDIMRIITTITNDIPKEERKNILFVIDSWGSMVTSKTMDNALVGNDAADFTIPRKKNNLANIILNTKATFFIINHVYDSMNVMGGDPLNIPGGRKIIFNCDCVGLGTSRAKDRDSEKNLIGNIITIQTFKSRFSKEKSKLKFRIKTEGGLDIFYGMLDDALESGVVQTAKPGYYIRSHIADDKPISEKNLYNSEFWLPIFKDTDFKDWLKNKYTFSSKLDISEESEVLDLMNKRKVIDISDMEEEVIETKKSKKKEV